MVTSNYVYQLRQLFVLSAPIFILCGIIGWFTKPSSIRVFVGVVLCMGVSLIFLLCLFFGFVAEKPVFDHSTAYFAQAAVYWTIPYFVFFLSPSILGAACGAILHWSLRKRKVGSQLGDVPVH